VAYIPYERQVILGGPNEVPPIPAYPWVLLHRGYFNELKQYEDIKQE
jgi:hypothetical protein